MDLEGLQAQFKYIQYFQLLSLPVKLPGLQGQYIYFLCPLPPEHMDKYGGGSNTKHIQYTDGRVNSTFKQRSEIKWSVIFWLAQTISYEIKIMFYFKNGLGQPIVWFSNGLFSSQLQLWFQLFKFRTLKNGLLKRLVLDGVQFDEFGFRAPTVLDIKQSLGTV